MDLPQNGVNTPRIIDLSPLLRDLDQQLEAAEQEARVVQLKIARVRGLRDGVLMAVERANQQPVVTTSDDPAPA
jgi:hypothetical protein